MIGDTVNIASTQMARLIASCLPHPGEAPTVSGTARLTDLCPLGESASSLQLARRRALARGWTGSGGASG